MTSVHLAASRPNLLLPCSIYSKFVDLLAQMKHGEVDGIKVRLDRLQAFIPTSYIEHIASGKDDDIDRQLQHKLM